MKQQTNLPRVAIVGRPNVGKSTLFNRLTRSRKALVEPTPGVTRDRVYGRVKTEEGDFILIDTGGILPRAEDQLARLTLEQTRAGIEEADLVLLVLDAKTGLTPLDEEVAGLVRTSGKPTIYVVNKVEARRDQEALAEFYRLGPEDLLPISATQGFGIEELLETIRKWLPEAGVEEEASEVIKIAFVGRPNVGKSSLVNRLLGEPRMIVSDLPGTTRDSIDTLLETPEGSRYLLIDTAGIRRRSRTQKKLEKFSVLKALSSIRACDVAVVVLTAEEGITDQDQKILSYVEEAGKGCVIVINKWDLLDGRREEANRLKEAVRYGARFVPYAPIITTSALTGRRVAKILEIIDRVYADYSRKLPTSAINRALKEATAQRLPSTTSGRKIKFYYATQVKIKPPTILIFTNYPEEIPESYRRFLTSKLREYLELASSPLKLVFKKRPRRP
ncbi:ribosome biogenesis GTPase Der [Thermosulfuriphilus sp.]